MLSEITGFQAIYIYCGKCDLRKGIDGLATLVKEQFHLDPFQKEVLFLFCGCRTDRFKGLVWEGDGFCLLYKRIEAGRLRWPRSQEEAARISPEELHLLLTGMTILERSSIQKCNCTEICCPTMQDRLFLLYYPSENGREGHSGGIFAERKRTCGP